ncbi:MAG: hypothetical protein U0R44_05435 [Candidatus Micrarchaeia archaeon]
MAMKERGANKGREAQKPREREPLSESMMAEAGSFFVHVKDPGQLAGLYKLVESELAAMGFSTTHGGLQCDPHPTMDVLDFFDVFTDDRSRRIPELFGSVNVYGREGRPLAMKLSTVYPGDISHMRKALEEALGKTIEGMGISGLSMALSHEPEP